ncbi:MAG TPA: hypothetical protein VMT00_10295 [Thermoanaerobaculia bacterium]|nr:hypothetical protein [Thermoanaerobaculia bacterium]
MTTKPIMSRELELASEILRPLVDEDAAELVSDGSELIRFRIRKRFGWKLVSVVFSRLALRRLVSDPLRSIKVEYLQREIGLATSGRKEYRYPRLERKSGTPAYSLAGL